MLGNVKLRLRQVRESIRSHGIRHTFSKVRQRLKHGPQSIIKSRNVFKHYDFICIDEIKLTGNNLGKNSLLWFIPDFNIGSGGHQTIFRMICHLEKMGWDSSIVVVSPIVHATADLAKKDITEHFFPLKAKVFMGFDGLPETEFVLATGWQTAYPVKAIKNKVKKLYFVQDFEPGFYPVGSESVLANNTYNFEFFGITAGGWLAKKLKDEYSMQTHAIGFGVDHDLYRQRPRREPHIKRVFFYARPPTPRRAFEFGLLVLDAVAKKLPNTEFILAGWDVSDYHIPFKHLAAGVISPEELADVFSQCDAALVLSLTNLSLMPLEVMAAGCAVVSNSGDCVEWLLNKDIALLTNPTLEDLSEAICSLLENDNIRKGFCERGQDFARKQHWQNSAQEFENGLSLARGYFDSI